MFLSYFEKPLLGKISCKVCFFSSKEVRLYVNLRLRNCSSKNLYKTDSVKKQHFAELQLKFDVDMVRSKLSIL